VRIKLRPGFPYGRPTWPGGVARPPVERRTGADFETDWSRRYPARLARAVLVDSVLRPAVRLLVGPEVHGLDRVAALDGPVIFVANHHSHLDTPVLLSSLPQRWRHRAVVAAAADYFFDTRVKGALSALVLGALPVERAKVDRRPIDQSLALLADGWSLVIFPEGGRSPDGWGQPFRRGAAFLGLRSGRPVVPVHIEGTGRVLPKGAKRPARADVHITYGSPMRAEDGESAHRFSDRIEAAVAALGDERSSDWWSARRRAAAGTTPALTGPGDLGSWRRSWALDRNRRAEGTRRWP
jgi:1-acyl-sn-glycerol-3-phosphate acyltransferase